MRQVQTSERCGCVWILENPISRKWNKSIPFHY